MATELFALWPDSALCIEGRLTPQHQDLGSRSSPLPETESSQRGQIDQQPQNDLE